MAKKDFLPVILGSDENAYGTARLFYEAYHIKPTLLCTLRLLPTRNSRIFNIREIRDFNKEGVFEKELYAFLTEAKQEYEHVLVVPCSDHYAGMLARHYDTFDGMISNRFVSSELIELLDTKEPFYNLCAECGLDFPKTVACDAADCTAAIDRIDFDFPVIVKPNNSNSYDYLHCKFEGKKKVFFFKTREEYLEIARRIEASDYRGRLLIQEFIEGDDSSMRVINSYSGLDGKVRAMSLGQPVLEEYAPTTLGNYAAIISRSDRELYEKVRGFLEKIGYVGFSNIDMKYDKKTGKYMVFELNPRLGRSSFFVRAAGFNMMQVLTDDVVYGKEASCACVDNPSLWYNVPLRTVKKYVRDDLRKEIVSLCRKRRAMNTLLAPYDLNPMRILRIGRYFMNQAKNYKKYFFVREK